MGYFFARLGAARIHQKVSKQKPNYNKSNGILWKLCKRADAINLKHFFAVHTESPRSREIQLDEQWASASAAIRCNENIIFIRRGREAIHQ